MKTDIPVTLAPEEFKALYDLTLDVVNAMVLESAKQTTMYSKPYQCIGFDDGMKLRDMIKDIANRTEEEQTEIHG